MKILIVSSMYPPIRTGTSFYTRNLAMALSADGHRIRVVSAFNAELAQEEGEYPVRRLPCVHLNIRNYFKHLRFTAFNPLNYLRVYKIAKSMEADAILLVNHYLDIAFPAIFASLVSGVPLVISVGTQLQSANPFRNRVLRWLDFLVCGFLVFPYARKIVAWDREIERYLNEVHYRRFANKTAIVPFGVNGTPEKYSNYRHEYEYHGQIVGVGAVIDHRNYKFQIIVFNKLLAQFPDLRLKIIGHVYNDEAVSLAKSLGIDDRVEFMGEIPHDGVLCEMNNSDIHWMMLDGEYKGLGTANLEAMLLGVPVVCNIPNGLFGEGSLVDLENFIYTDDISLDDTTQKIGTILKSIAKRQQIGQAGRRFVEENMNWKSVAGKMADSLAEVATR